MPLVEGERVELTGIATPIDDPLESPLTGEPCIAHLSRARVYNRLDHVGDHLGDVERLDVAPFLLATPSGTVRVVDKPTVVALDLALLGWVDPMRGARFLAARGFDRFVRSSFFEYAIIRPGDQVSVAGVVTREADAVLETGFRDLQLQTRLTGYGRNPLTLRQARR